MNPTDSNVFFDPQALQRAFLPQRPGSQGAQQAMHDAALARFLAPMLSPQGSTKAVSDAADDARLTALVHAYESASGIAERHGHAQSVHCALTEEAGIFGITLYHYRDHLVITQQVGVSSTPTITLSNAYEQALRLVRKKKASARCLSLTNTLQRAKGHQMFFALFGPVHVLAHSGPVWPPAKNPPDKS